MEDKASFPVPSPHPRLPSLLPSLPLSIPSHLSFIFPHFSHFTSFSSPLSFCHPVIGNLTLKIFILSPHSFRRFHGFNFNDPSSLLFVRRLNIFSLEKCIFVDLDDYWGVINHPHLRVSNRNAVSRRIKLQLLLGNVCHH